MEVKKLEDIEQLKQLHQASFEQDGEGVLIFKHSSRCGVSSWAWKRIQKEWRDHLKMPVYFLDLIRYRDISNRISEEYQVRHQSPQLIWIAKGEMKYNASHSEVSVDNILKALNK